MRFKDCAAQSLPYGEVSAERREGENPPLSPYGDISPKGGDFRRFVRSSTSIFPQALRRKKRRGRAALPPVRYAGSIGMSFPPARYASSMGMSFPPARYASSMGMSFPPARYASSTGMSFPPARYASSTGMSFPPARYASSTGMSFPSGPNRTGTTSFPVRLAMSFMRRRDG